MDGCILEGQCECAAGMDPKADCKHVRSVLYALIQFSKKLEIMTEETCTQRLQTFQKSKPFHCSPIKAKNLSLSSEMDGVNYDPRPPKYRNFVCYSGHFRSVWLNHTGVNNYPISHLFRPANPYAVDKDHDYMQTPLSEMWLKD